MSLIPRRSNRSRQELTFAVLNSIKENPLRITDIVYTVASSRVPGILKEAEDAGLLQSAQIGKRARSYSITRKGIEFLKGWKETNELLKEEAA